MLSFCLIFCFTCLDSEYVAKQKYIVSLTTTTNNYNWNKQLKYSLKGTEWEENVGKPLLCSLPGPQKKVLMQLQRGPRIPPTPLSPRLIGTIPPRNVHVRREGFRVPLIHMPFSSEANDLLFFFFFNLTDRLPQLRTGVNLDTSLKFPNQVQYISNVTFIISGKMG